MTPEYWGTHSISGDYRNSTMVTGALILLFMLIGLPGNTVIIVCIIKQRLFKEVTHLLLLNLAVSDFLLCLLVMPFTVVAGFAGGYVLGGSDYTRCQVCQQTGVILTFTTSLSIKILCLMSLDRFIFIKFPLYYSRWVTLRKVIIAIILAWLLSSIEALPPVFGFGLIKYGYATSSCYISFFTKASFGIEYTLLLVAISTIVVIVTIVTNIWIACITRKQIWGVYGSQLTSSKEENKNQAIKKRTRKKMMKKQMVLIRAFGGILLANIIVWFPMIIFAVVLQVVDKVSIPLGIYVCIYLSLIMHSVVHPLIEAYFIPEIRIAICKALCLHHCKPQNCTKNRDTSNTMVRNSKQNKDLEIKETEMKTLTDI